MSVLTESFLKPEAHFIPSKAEVIHLANSVVLAQFNFPLYKKEKENSDQQSEKACERRRHSTTTQMSDVFWKQSRDI